jgi:NNP family nitrate/nitrite transporter-like MFS transporter
MIQPVQESSSLRIVIGEQIKAGTPQYAMYGFAIFYALCLILNWWFYLRRKAYVKNP